MNVGDIVKNKSSNTLGVVEYSTFGFSIHFMDETHNCLGKTLGAKKDSLNKHWDVVELPSDYELNEYGCPVKRV